MGQIPRLSLLLIGLLVIRPVWSAEPASGTPVTNIVVIEALDRGRPFWREFEVHFRRQIMDISGRSVAIYGESADMARFPEVDYSTGHERWLRQKYASKPVDAIVASAGVPVETLLHYREKIWGRVPLVVVAAPPELARALPRESGVSALLWRPDAIATVEAATALFPTTRRILMVGGERFRDPVGATIREKLASSTEGPALAEPQSSTVAGLREELASLDRDTVILFSGVYGDANAVGLGSREVLDALAGAANRPIFALSRTYLGHGVVGGAMIDPAAYGNAAADKVMEVLRRPGAMIPHTYPARSTDVVLDYRQLKRWGVEGRSLPSGARVLFRPPGLWDAYRDQVILAVAVLLLQSALLVVLLLERGRRRRAEDSMRELSADLLVSQEDERSRIARELHDGVNQRVALLAIGLDGAALSAGGGRESTGLLRQLADEVRGIGSEIHAVARRLRPPQIGTAGLPAALEDLAAGTAERAGIEVTVEEQNWPGNVTEPVAIVLYRVTQECLQNVVKHSGATAVRITMSADRDDLVLCVRDNGRGGAPQNTALAPGIGLTSMKERLNLIGGSLQIRSSTDGTSITARIPLPEGMADSASPQTP